LAAISFAGFFFAFYARIFRLCGALLRMRGKSCPLKQGIDECFGVEFGDIFGFFPESDEFYGDIKLVFDGDDDTAAGARAVPSSLARNIPVTSMAWVNIFA
jgi:hypothetical protein